MTDRNAITQALVDQMSDTRTPMQYPPLDAKALIDSGALRVVQHPGEAMTNDPELYSLVTPWNDTRPGSPTPFWPNKPAAYAAAQRDLANPQSGALYAGKYRQILNALGQGSGAP